MFERVKNILVDALNVDENLVTPEASLKDDLGIDSLSAAEMSLELESEFNCVLSDEELQNLVTVDDVVKLVESK